MKTLSRISNIIFYLIVLFLIISSVGTVITKNPFFLTAVRSNSMYPLFQRGDMLIIQSILPNTPLKTGDIIIFKTESESLPSGEWISHRIVGGNSIDGYITKGDANQRSDQEDSGIRPIKHEWISSRVITIDNLPVKIPLIGFLPLWMEGFRGNPYILPIITVVLALVIGASEFFGKKKRKKKSGLELPLVYFLSGLTLSIILCASMLASSQHLTVEYEVSETSRGVIMGSNVGILKVGENIERPLSELNNKGIFPIIATMTSSDPQISYSHDSITLIPGQQVQVTMKVEASKPGIYKPTIHVGMFFPFLPTALILILAKISYWLALIVVSLIPSIPVIIYPLIDSRLRRKTLNVIHRKLRKIKNLIPV